MIKERTMEEFKKVIILKNEVEASLIESILNERKIPYLIKSYHDSAYNGMFQFQKGWGHLKAPESYAEEIIAIYEDMIEQEQDEID